MADDVSFSDLLELSLGTDDPFLAAACHPYANPRDRSALESILFATSKLKRQLAGALHTPPSVLHSLATDGDRQIRMRVAKHPAVTPATLRGLAQAANAVDLDARVAAHPSTPRNVLKNLYERHPSSSKIKRALCDNPRTPGPLLPRLVVGASSAELKGIARNAEAGGASLRMCWEQQDVYLQAEVAAHPNCPADLRDVAEQATQALVRRKLAQNPVLSDGVLMRLLGDAEAQVRAAAVRSLGASVTAELDSVGCDPSRLVRRDQARRRELPLSWIDRLAQDTDSWVRRLVARNPGVPGRTLGRLADDPVMEVRRGVARNPVCPGKLLGRLARDPHPWVRAGVALRDDIAAPLIVEMSRDDDIDVLSALGKNPNTPPGVLDRIARHEHRDVRRAVATNGKAPRSVVRRLTEDPYPINRVLLAGHRNLDDADLLSLAHDPEPTVRFAGARALAERLHVVHEN